MKFCEIVLAVLADHPDGVQLVADLLRGKVRERGMLVAVSFEGHEIHGLKPHVAQLKPTLVPIFGEQEAGVISLKTDGHPQRICGGWECDLRRKGGSSSSRSCAAQELSSGHRSRWSLVSHAYFLLFDG